MIRQKRARDHVNGPQKHFVTRLPLRHPSTAPYQWKWQAEYIPQRSSYISKFRYQAKLNKDYLILNLPVTYKTELIEGRQRTIPTFSLILAVYISHVLMTSREYAR